MPKSAMLLALLDRKEQTAVCSLIVHKLLEFYGVRRKILFNHQSDLEDDCVVELAQIQAGELLDLFKSVNQGVTVNEELS